MSPTYLVLLRAGDAALVLHEGQDFAAAEAVALAAYREHAEKPRAIDAADGVYLVTVRSEAVFR